MKLSKRSGTPMCYYFTDSKFYGKVKSKGLCLVLFFTCCKCYILFSKLSMAGNELSSLSL